MTGGIETTLDGKSREIALAEREWYFSQEETIRDQSSRFDKADLKNYSGKVFFGFLRQEDLYLPVFALGFDGRLLSAFKTSSHDDLAVTVRGFYRGSRNNISCNPFF